MAALTAGAVVLRRRQSYLLVGWLWYLGMLVPVIGILQVGRQAYADRYTYLSEIGLCIAGTWAVVECAAGWRHRRVVLSGVAAAVLATLTASAYRQAGYWRDNETLWRHTVESTKNNDVALFNLGDAVVQSGRVDEGIIYYKMALGISPRDAEGHKTLADALVQSGRMQEAMSEYRTALKLNPDYPQASYNFGMAFTKEGKIREAMAQYRNVLTKHPDSVYPLNGLAWLLATAGDKSLRDGPQAVRLAERAQRLTNGSDANILDTLAAAYAEVGDFASAVRTARSALQVAEAQSNTDLAGLVRREIKLYETQQRP